MLLPVTDADGVLLDLRYATADNLTGRPIYTRPVALLLPEARERLFAARDAAARLGLRLKILDAFRPIEAQWALWHAVEDKRFVADPRAGGVHPRGAAVDLTLCDATTGAELPMGTPFDATEEESAHGHPGVPVEDQRNRALLLGLMTAAGWDHYRLEWWHYQLPDARRFPPLNASAVKDGPM
ncbi:D-alanyl-D-alanine dipeptidase [Teichococcus cervicalis]|uniref:D-alanyl-D-alanine dipeptidase n=1 Tax=Pseudoroseomonas cervicalis ATCC 49957 TaxID=525371 RepID=D5RH78_9PROT|nr:D-alanyl-D-alanine dipeptidase [Pseudoroseomonas cervicalis]EFH13349.1 D-Ala-D-Ala dipeptidase [Pseudoroseomonas cervicalis ATCC 49957]